MSEKLLEFKKVLEEIFEMDKSDLDFGIYRIINQKREQVNEFLDKDLLPQVKEELKTFQAKEISKEENEIFSHLATFFRRYYEGGDFISKRRYKEGVYAIPYEGEEVKLYWANHDQYYIKTSENLTNFAFKLSSGKRIHFRIVDGEMNKDNNKTEQGKDRLFVLDKKNPLNIEEEDIYINFIYQLAEKKEKQTDLNKEAAKKILKLKEIKEYEEELSK
ncbi:MAG: site-specific DNA-methyltransferase, partial [Leptospiraceae bacterium]|nr:site-specific DNA-methyltransferase [Leptospiraceae bacterium]